ncbi:PucR family transcriptional regulator ligand-binding domain-containing protein [Blastococcus saxobsidens]|uniref:PucR family transcriptional regulator ligand-binding domain-containing protein n=1 Tax=Blastococcus saxobsidens TaxID=138336 RepID=UPI0009FED80E
MTLTVNRLPADPRLGLTLVGGAAGADRPITRSHAIELEDPTPWLSGGELVMTTGPALSAVADDPPAVGSRLAVVDGDAHLGTPTRGALSGRDRRTRHRGRGCRRAFARRSAAGSPRPR